MTEREMKQRKAAARKARQRKARNRRVLTTVALMLVVCVASIGGTIAWLTDTSKPVVNTFSASDINIWMTETVDGKLEETTATAGITNNNFKMVPGTSEPKDPNVVIGAGSEDCWVFVKVKEAGGVVTVNTKTTQFSDFIGYSVDTNNWTKLENAAGLTDGETVYYTFCRDLTADRRIKVLLNQQVSYPETITKEMMNALGENKPSLTFEAYAIQMANGNDTEFSAGAAWNELNPTTTQP